VYVLRRSTLLGTSRHVRHPNYESVRLLLAADDVGVGLTDVTLDAGVEGTYGYPDRVEIAYCISGSATVVELDSGTRHHIGPGVMWVAPPGSRFSFVAAEPTRLICVFDPALEGHETGLVDEDPGARR
jgi:L-ectoine synthase